MESKREKYPVVFEQGRGRERGKRQGEVTRLGTESISTRASVEGSRAASLRNPQQAFGSPGRGEKVCIECSGEPHSSPGNTILV